MKTIFYKLWTLISKDIGCTNETKKSAVIMRLLCLMMFLYFILETAVRLASGRFSLVFVSAAFAFAYFVCMYLTYIDHVRMARIFIKVFTVLLVIIYVALFGWFCGVQHMLYVLLVFQLLTSHSRLPVKAASALLLFFLRIVLYFCTQYFPPVLDVTRTEQDFLQIFYTFNSFAGIICMTLVFARDSLKMERKLLSYSDEMKHLASTDPLTHLCNRRAAIEFFQNLQNLPQEKASYINIAIGDIDFFKVINDTYGHDAGDAVLSFLSQMFTNFMRGKGIVARWGGEEFLFIITGINGDQALTELENLRNKIELSHIPFNGMDLRVKMTFGLQEHSMESPMEQTVDLADKKLYYGKSRGRNQVVF